MSQSIWSKKSIKPYEGIGCSDSVKVFSFLWRLRNKFSFLWKMRKKVFAFVKNENFFLIFVKNEKKNSHFCEKWEKKFSFSWKMRKKCLNFMKNDPKMCLFREKWPKNVPFFMKNEKKSSHFREKWEKNSQFCEKCAKKLVSHVPHFSVELSLTICIGWELKIATFVVKVQYTTIHFEEYMKKLCCSPAIRAKDLLLVQTMSSIGVS